MSAALDLDLLLDSHDDALEPHRGVEFHEMPVRQILNRCTNPRCRFDGPSTRTADASSDASTAMRAIPTTSSSLRDPMDFERRIFVKRMAAG